MSRARHLLLAAATILGAACSDDPTGPRQPAAGTYRLDLAGDYAARHTGAAVFGADGPEGQEFFAVLLGTEQVDMANLVILRSGATRLEVGTHQVANTSDQLPDAPNAIEILLGVGNDTSSTVGFFDGKSGTVTVTKSSATALAGSFDVVVTGLLEQGGHDAEPATLRVRGAFTAEPAEGATNARVRVTELRMQRVGR